MLVVRCLFNEVIYNIDKVIQVHILNPCPIVRQYNIEQILSYIIYNLNDSTILKPLNIETKSLIIWQPLRAIKTPREYHH